MAGRELEAGFKLHLDRKSAKVSMFPHFRGGDLNGGGGGHKHCILSMTQVSLVARRSVLPIPPSTSTQALSQFIQVISLDLIVTDIAWCRTFHSLLERIALKQSPSLQTLPRSISSNQH